MAVHVRAALVCFSCLALASLSHAGDMCPAPPTHSKRPATPIASGDHLIHIDAGGAKVDADGHAELSDRVEVSQDGRTVSADSMNYDYNTGKIAVAGAVDFEDPRLRLKSDTGTYDTIGGADLRPGEFPDSRPQRPRRRPRDGGPARRPGAARSGALHHLSGGQRGLDAAGLLHRPGHQRSDRRRPARAHALQGRADLLHALHLVSAGRRAQERPVVSRLRSFEHERLPARDTLLLQSGAELRRNLDAGHSVGARRAAGRRVSLPDREFARHARRQLPAERQADAF